MSDHVFESAWVTLAREGSCDSPGSAEYERVKTEWIAAGRPAGVYVFIVEAANRPAPPKKSEDESKKKTSAKDVSSPGK